jgi:ankyrin repeat protein
MKPARLYSALIAPALMLGASPAAAQFQSDGYKFLTAVRDAKPNDVISALNKPGNTLVNARDTGTGETALHIVVKRGDQPYTSFLLAKGADPNARDNKGNTPLTLAAAGGYDNLIELLVNGKANVNLGNGSGETPLILAVHRRDTEMVRELIKNGADPDQADVLAGKSARDYATLDTRNSQIARIFAETPKKARASVAGPRLR